MARCKHCGEEDETGWCCIEKSIAIDEAREHLRDCAEAWCEFLAMIEFDTKRNRILRNAYLKARAALARLGGKP